MGTPINYTDIDFVNGGAPALNATNLNHIVNKSKAAADRVDAYGLDATCAAKTTIVDADELLSRDSADGNYVKKLTWANLKAAILTAIGKSNLATGFTLAGGTTSKTLTVSADADSKDIPTAAERAHLTALQAASGATTALKISNLAENASTTQEGVSEFATAAELVTGTDDTRVPTVKQLKDSLALDSMWLTKRTKMPDGAAMVYSVGSEQWATDGWSASTRGTVTLNGSNNLVLTPNGTSASPFVTRSLPLPAGTWIRGKVRYTGNQPNIMYHNGVTSVVSKKITFTGDTIEFVGYMIAAFNLTVYGSYVSAAAAGSSTIEFLELYVGPSTWIMLAGSALEESISHSNLISANFGTPNLATQVLDVYGTIADGDTFTAGDKVYTWKDVLTPAEGQVLIDGNNTNALANAALAVNRTDPGANDGVKYKIAAANCVVSATGSTATTLSVQALPTIIPEEYGNLIAVAENNAKMAWRGSYLVGGRSSLSAKTREMLGMGQRQSRWMGKTINFLGDSITEGAYCASPDTEKYCEIVKSELGLATANEYGTSGSLVAVIGGKTNSFAERYSGMVDADAVVVFGGVNDYLAGTGAMGAVDSTTTTEFNGALNVLIAGLKAKYPAKTIIFITPLKCYFDSHTSDVANSSSGQALQGYRDAIIERCLYHSIPVVDLYALSGIDPAHTVEERVAPYTYEGLHPLGLYQSKIGKQIAGFLAAL